MKAVHQTLFGGPDGPVDEIGNCYPACMASILEVDLDDVPHVYQLHKDPEDAVDEALRFLNALGFTTMRFKWEPWTCRYLNGSLAIFSGKSPRGDWQHAVVGQVTDEGWRLVHDPHPSGDGIVGDPEDIEMLLQMVMAPANDNAPPAGYAAANVESD